MSASLTIEKGNLILRTPYDADFLVKTLYEVLPQGTFDRLGIEFMKKKVSLYRGKTDG